MVNTELKYNFKKQIFTLFKDKIIRSFVSEYRRDVYNLTKRSLKEKQGKSLWQAISKSLEVDTSSNNLKLYSDHPAASIRQYGGLITAKRSNYLTIPVGDAEGKTVGEMKRNGYRIFKINNVLLGKRGNGKAQLLFILKKQVRHPADPWLPQDRQLFLTAEQALNRIISR